ncbi:MAG: hypothetical protein GF329_06945 [Candidatus Lokiarchaeota archaeon]|nr:hypothetical protein [Candidatus Lokiarchaeota archaeon]
MDKNKLNIDLIIMVSFIASFIVSIGLLVGIYFFWIYGLGNIGIILLFIFFGLTLMTGCLFFSRSSKKSSEDRFFSRFEKEKEESWKENHFEKGKLEYEQIGLFFKEWRKKKPKHRDKSTIATQINQENRGKQSIQKDQAEITPHIPQANEPRQFSKAESTTEPSVNDLIEYIYNHKRVSITEITKYLYPKTIGQNKMLENISWKSKLKSWRDYKRIKRVLEILIEERKVNGVLRPIGNKLYYINTD